GTDRPFSPQQFVGKRWNVAHVDAAAYDGASLTNGGKGSGHQRTNRRKNNRCVEFLGRTLVRSSCPNRAEFPGKPLRFQVPGPREPIDAASLVHGHLSDDVRRCPESVNAQALS